MKPNRASIAIEIFITALVLAFIAYAAIVSLLIGEIGLQYKHPNEVWWVTPDSAAERAGVRVGDRIVSVDGYSIQDLGLPIWRWRSGHALEYIVERENQRLALSVEVAPRTVSSRWLDFIPIIVAFAFWVASAFIPGFLKQDSLVRLFRIQSQGISLMLAAGSLGAVGALWFAPLFHITLLALVPIAPHFHLTIFYMKRYRRLILFVWYAISAEQVIEALLGIRVLPLNSRLLAAVSLLSSLLWLVYGYTTTQSRQMRRRLRVIVLSSLLASVPILFLSVFPEVFLGDPILPYPATMTPLILFPLAYWYAIMRHDLWRVDIFLNRVVTFFITTSILGAIYLSFSRLLIVFYPYDSAFSHDAAGILTLIVIVVAFVPLNNVIQRAVDRLFYGGWYDYRTVVSDMSPKLSSVLSREQLEKLLLENASKALWVRGSALLLPNSRSSNDLTGRRFGEFRADTGTLQLKTDGPLGRRLQELRFPVSSVDLRRTVRETLPHSESLLIANDTIRWWIPIASADRLVGVFLLGARAGEEQFDGTDLQILSTLSNQAALAIENLLLVEELQGQLTEISESRRTLEQMHHRLLLGRDEERKRLARELHDGAIQIAAEVRHKLGTQVSRQEIIDDLEQLMGDLRETCSKLRPPLLDDFGLVAAMRAFSSEKSEQHELDIQIYLTHNGRGDSSPLLPPERAYLLYRIFTEAMTNTIQHAQATEVFVALRYNGEQVSMEIADNGRGFDTWADLDRLATEGHFGLLGIRERVSLLGGSLEIKSEPGFGTTLRVDASVEGGNDGDNRRDR